MHERRSGLTMTFGRLSRSRGNPSPSAVSPKSPESSPRLQTSPANNTSPVASRPTRSSLPATTPTRPQGVQRVMTEPVRPPLPAAVVARPRSVSYSTRPSAPSASSLPVRAPSQPSNPSTIPQGRFRQLLHCINFKTRSKRKPSKAGNRKNYGLILALFIFCLTAIIYIALAFSLQTFPSYTHIVFIGILFVEFACVIRFLLNHAKRTRQAISATPMQEGPPAGAIIHGASNWDGLSDDQHPGGFNLEEIGTTEALKPIPPAYGHYRGSVRIKDSDIRWVRRDETTEVPVPRVEGTVERGGHVVRPPSYGSDGGAIV